MTLKIKNDVEKKKLRDITKVKLLKKIKKGIKNSKSETIKLKRLFSENLMFFLAFSIIKIKLKKNTQ